MPQYFTLVAYDESESHPVTGNLMNIAAVPDSHVTVAGDDIFVPKLSKLAGYWAGGPTILRGRIDTPSLRCIADTDIDPVNVAALPISRPPFHDLFYTPVDLQVNEAMEFLTHNAAAERNYGLVWLSDGPRVPVQTQERSIYCRGLTLTVADQWTPVPLIGPSTLAAGRYAIVGMWPHSTHCIAARLIIPNFCYRPGTVGCQTAAMINPDRFRHGANGIWAEFDSRSPPQAEFLTSAADTTEYVVLDIAYLGPS